MPHTGWQHLLVMTRDQEGTRKRSFLEPSKKNLTLPWLAVNFNLWNPVGCFKRLGNVFLQQ